MRSAPLRTSALVLAALALAPGCDTYDDNNEDDDRINVVTFSFDGDDATISDDGRIASFDTDDIASANDQTAVEDALDEADLGGVVLLYADGGLVFDGGEGTWTALPLTRAFEAVNAADELFVDFTATYSYSYDDADLYFDVLSSAEFDGLSDEDYATVIPSQIELRLVTIREDDFADARAAGVDFESYAAVRQAFALPE